MHKNSIAGTVVIMLLLFSILSGIFIVFQQKVKKFSNTLNFSKIISIKKNSIGVVEIYGPIFAPYDSAAFMSKSGYRGILDTLKSFREDKSIKAVILKINCPGGTIGAVQEITQEVQRLRTAGKPVVAQVSDLAASGGYYIAANCDKIIANPGSIIGSIGVIFMSPDISELMKKIGIKYESIKSGPYKDVGSIYRPLSKDEKVFLNEMISDAYSQFVETVSKGRNLTELAVKRLAKGQLYTGRKAKELKLIDGLGDFIIAIKVAEDIAGIKNADIVQPSSLGLKRILSLINNKVSLSGIFGEDRVSGLAYIYKP